MKIFRRLHSSKGYIGVWQMGKLFQYGRMYGCCDSWERKSLKPNLRAAPGLRIHKLIEEGKAEWNLNLV